MLLGAIRKNSLSIYKIWKKGKKMKKKIMVVDDNRDIIDMVRDGLEHFSKGYEIIGAGSGKECFELLKKNQIPDLILLDIMMPEMSGWDVFARLKENPGWRSIPVVFITVKSDPYSKGFGKTTADDYIEKPFAIMDLKERIDKILNR